MVTYRGKDKKPYDNNLILADAVMFATSYPGAKCCILREEINAVKQSFLDKLPSLFPQYVDGVQVYTYHEKSTSWYPSRSIVFPNGSYITLQRVASYKEALDFQGYEFNYLAIDEVTKQEERAVDYMLTTVRSVVKTNPYTNQPIKIPTKIVFGCNPGGQGHKWVKKRFIDPTVTHWDQNGTPILTQDYVESIKHPFKPMTIKRHIRFIPAQYKDNPYLADSYVTHLMSQPEHKQAMDMYGRWDVVAGRMFDWDDQNQYIDSALASYMVYKDTVPFDVYISIDWGYKPSYHCALWHAVFTNGRVVTFKELYGQELIFEDFVNRIAEMSKEFYVSGTLLPHDMFRQGDRYRDGNGKIIGETKADVFEAKGLNPISVESGKGKVMMRYDKIHSATKMKEADNIYKFRISKACSNLIDEMENAVYDDFDPTRIAPACKDHAIDAYGLFLVFYSEDIAPIGEEHPIYDTRSRLQRMLDEEEAYLTSEEDDLYMCIEDNWDL